MNSLKKTLVLTFSLLALLAANAAAQCGGKKVYIELPDNWGRNLYYNWQGSWQLLNTSKEGNYTVFTFPRLNNDNPGSADRFALQSVNDYYVQTGMNVITAKLKHMGIQNLTDAIGQNNANGFTCNDFFETTYISFPNGRLDPIISGDPPDAKYFYFFPPDDPAWIAGKSHIKAADTLIAMEADPNRCGWYRTVFFNVANFATRYTNVQIVLGANSSVVLPGEPINLSAKYSNGKENGGDMYLVADEINSPSGGWYTSDPMIADPSRCRYNLAAFIYDTDASVHPDFSCGEYKNEDNCTGDVLHGQGKNNKSSCTGVQKNVVMQTLGEDKKMRYNSSGDVNKCWTNETWFNAAFTGNAKVGNNQVNVQSCFNMPFEQKASGRYEFDSDEWTKGGRLVGGFFLGDNDLDGDYTSCRTCNTKRAAEVFVPLVSGVTKDAFDSYQSAQNNFKDGEARPTIGDVLGTTATGVVWDWGKRDNLTWYGNGNGNTAIKGSDKGSENQHFCFESHASFRYDPDQEFYFRGDDAIWIFIDNKLVVDLGGAHLAAPGHIKLKDMTPALEEGREYDIDIFFCDLRTTQSNVRISTNMYITQKNAFSQSPSRNNNSFCILETGGGDCGMGSGGKENEVCGNELIKAGYTLEFYIMRPGVTEPLLLNPTTNSECSGTANNFTCYGGIVVNNGTYSCGGAAKCSGNATATSQVNFNENGIVYVRPMKDGGQADRPISIDQFTKTEAQHPARIVWGKLKNEDTGAESTLPAGIGSTRTDVVMAGTRVPIYIASGEWADNTFTTFNYHTENVVGKGYSLIDAGMADGNGFRLRVYNSRNGTVPADRFVFPANGVDTLWIEGIYDMDEQTYKVNVTPETETAPSKNITIYQPVLKFLKANLTDTLPAMPANAKSGLDPALNGEIPYVGSRFFFYIQAWDPLNDEFCEKCNFRLSAVTSVNNSALAARAYVTTDLGGGIENGIAIASSAGLVEVIDTNFVALRFQGPNNKATYATWEKLQFQDVPAPIPAEAYIYDTNGDGIGNRLEIVYNKPFRKANGDIDATQLPCLIEASWSKDTTLSFHNSGASYLDKLGTGTADADASQKCISDNILGENIRIPEGRDSLIVIDGVNFSKGILTYSESTYLRSCVGFDMGGTKGLSNTCADGTAITDRIPPIVVKAVYTPDKGGKCASSANGCRDKLSVTLSERIFEGPEGYISDLAQNPFAYCYGYSQQTNCLKVGESMPANTNGWDWENPGFDPGYDGSYSVIYKPNGGNNVIVSFESGSKGDSIADMVYYSKESTRMPQAGDWIRLRFDNSRVFKDLEGNSYNENELGVRIDGETRSKKDPVLISTLPKVNENTPPLAGVFVPGTGPNGNLWWMTEAAKEEGVKLYDPNNNRVTEILPLLETHNADSARFYYPSSVGTVYTVDINNKVNDVLAKCKNKNSGQYLCTTLDGKPLNDEYISEAITLRAEVYYHTNLGNYVAESSDKTSPKTSVSLKCGDPLFQDKRSQRTDYGNCLTNKNLFYLAWDLKTNNNRFVGAGAYVAIANFWWEIKYKDIGGNEQTEKFDKSENITMYGVKRTK